MCPFFCLPLLTVKDLNQLLQLRGYPPLEAPGEHYLCLKVLLMGWSWSVWVAETCVEDVIIRGSSILISSARLRHGQPAPPVEKDLPIPWFTYIDDLGAWIWGSSDAAAVERGWFLLRELREVFERAGLRLHKEEVGFRLETVGLRTGRDPDSRPRTVAKPEGLHVLALGTQDLLDRGKIGPVAPRRSIPPQGIGVFATSATERASRFSITFTCGSLGTEGREEASSGPGFGANYEPQSL